MATFGKGAQSTPTSAPESGDGASEHVSTSAEDKISLDDVIHFGKRLQTHRRRQLLEMAPTTSSTPAEPLVHYRGKRKLAPLPPGVWDVEVWRGPHFEMSGFGDQDGGPGRRGFARRPDAKTLRK